eukprot:TRINITY_DN9024_c0_g2_i1.p1 TRINITY_DN9024_c0_g2~~TRINITY_DN9024_c0_g2_i1.p1  ORF type:complete len:269 (+),score=18.15 TRINITY_DN9024_c0_g2_i1:97-903(+)
MLYFMSTLVLIIQCSKVSARRLHQEERTGIATMGCDPTYQNCTSQPVVSNDIRFSDHLLDSQAPAPSSPSPQSQQDCADVTPQGVIECSQYLQNGWCDKLPEHLCALTCSFCCTDKPLNDFITCEDIVHDQKCEEVIDMGYCLESCGACGRGRLVAAQPPSTELQGEPSSFRSPEPVVLGTGATTADLNIRSGPSTQYVIRTQVPYRTVLQLICYKIGQAVFRNQDWIYINYGESSLEDDKYGYASDYYIDCDDTRCKYHWNLPECSG